MSGVVDQRYNPHGLPETVHACPEGDSATTPCCDLSPFELPIHHRITLDPDLVTCDGQS